jgi:CheY-like chemotaxis protein
MHTDDGTPAVATVLVVEDERKLRELLRTYLEREGLAHHGTVVADSTPGVGTRITVRLPAAPAPY